jgi:hypothetical protein
LGKTVKGSLGDCEVFDACVLCDLADPEESYRRLLQDVEARRIFLPAILNLEGRQQRTKRAEKVIRANRRKTVAARRRTCTG